MLDAYRRATQKCGESSEDVRHSKTYLFSRRGRLVSAALSKESSCQEVTHHIYIYIHREREREVKKEEGKKNSNTTPIIDSDRRNCEQPSIKTVEAIPLRVPAASRGPKMHHQQSFHRRVPVPVSERERRTAYRYCRIRDAAALAVLVPSLPPRRRRGRPTITIAALPIDQ
jgi:hypothetical protein